MVNKYLGPCKLNLDLLMAWVAMIHTQKLKGHLNSSNCPLEVAVEVVKVVEAEGNHEIMTNLLNLKIHPNIQVVVVVLNLS